MHKRRGRLSDGGRSLGGLVALLGLWTFESSFLALQSLLLMEMNIKTEDMDDATRESFELAWRLQAEEDARVAEQQAAATRLQDEPEDAESLALAIRLQQEDDEQALRNAMGETEEEGGDLSPSQYSYEQLMRLGQTIGEVSRGASAEHICALRCMGYEEARKDSSIILGEQVRMRERAPPLAWPAARPPPLLPRCLAASHCCAHAKRMRWLTTARGRSHAVLDLPDGVRAVGRAARDAMRPRRARRVSRSVARGEQELSAVPQGDCAVAAVRACPLVGANGGLRGADGRRREDGRRVDVRVAAASGGRVVAAASGGRGVKTR